MKAAAHILYRVLWALLSVLPLRVCFTAGWLLGGCAFWLLGHYRRLAVDNITRAFEGELSKREARRLAARHFRRLGANLLSTPRLASLPESGLRKLVAIAPSAMRIKEVQQSGRGVVTILSHLGNWEIAAFAAPHFLQGPLGAIYQRIGNPGIDAHIRRVRERFGVTLLERRSGIAKSLAILRQGGAVGILADQNAGDSGVWAPFFRCLTSTSPLPGLLANRTGAALVPLSVRTTGWGRWRIEAGEPLEPHPDNGVTAAIANRLIEEEIRKAPEDWFWVHDRWKVPRSNFLLTGARRGVALPPGCDFSQLRKFHIVVRSPNWLGDAVMSTPAVLALRAGRPDARITIAAPAHLRDVWEIVPGVDAIVVLPRRGSVKTAACLIRKAGRADAAVLLPNSLRSALEARRAGIRYLVGYKGHSRAWALTKVIPAWRADHPPPHQIDRCLRIAEKCGASVQFGAGVTGVMVRPDRECMEGQMPVVAICPGAEYGPAKRWPAERFAEAALAVSEKRPCRWRVVGLDREAALGEKIAATLTGAGLEAENLCGKTSLKELIDLLARCCALLTNDTGTMHLATLIGTPVVAVFGPTEPAFTGPRGARHTVLHHRVPCAPCFLRKCPLDHRCMSAVSPGEAAEALLAALTRRTSAPL